jgi:hypothetical protein
MKNLSAKKVPTLFSREAIKELRKDRFSGNIIIKWENGVIEDLDLTDKRLENQL